MYHWALHEYVVLRASLHYEYKSFLFLVFFKIFLILIDRRGGNAILCFYLEFGLRKLRERTYRQGRKTERLPNGSGEQRDTMAYLFFNRHMHCPSRNIHRYRY